MNRRMILYMPLQILKAEAFLLLLPACVSLIYGEKSAFGFLICSAGMLALSFPLAHFLKPKDRVIYAKEGFVIVALSWIFMSAFGALPFVISDEIPSYIDALFETASGFSTTGASIVTDLGSMSHGMLFWRSFTHWLGGMGILVFLMALTNTSDRPIHIMRAEMPGPVVGKIVPRAKDTAKILYLLYLGLTVAEAVCLLIGGLDLFESLVYAFGTAGTGGFGLRADSLVGYSTFVQWVITVFMFLFGINFNLYYLFFVRRAGDVVRNRELWTYVGIAAAATVLIYVNTYPLTQNAAVTLKDASFQTAAILMTTGFASVDFNLWPQLSKNILFILMFIGGCAGSTAGGFKISRLMILCKVIRREVVKLLHPRSVKVIRMEGKKVDEAVIHNTCSYLAVYCLCIFIVFFLLSFDAFDLETSFTATVSCFNNIGPAFGAAGPMEGYAAFSGFSKLVLTAAMLLGRLEVFPILLAVSPDTWIKK